MKTLCCYILIVVLLTATILFQTRLLNERFSFSFDNPECPWCDGNQIDEIRFIPAKTLFIRLFAPADPDLTADFLWVRTKYYFGAHAVTDQDYFFLNYLLEKITDLAPHWKVPYIFGAVVLYLEAQMPDDALWILDKGLASFEDDWQFYFLKGYIYWKAFENLEEASQQIFEASKQKDAPQYLRGLSATLASRSGNRAFMETFYRIIDQHVDDPEQKQKIREKLKGN